MCDFPTEDEVVPFRTERHGHFTAEENESEDVAVLKQKHKIETFNYKNPAHLFPALQEEVDWVIAIRNSRTDYGQPVEDFGW